MNAKTNLKQNIPNTEKYNIILKQSVVNKFLNKYNSAEITNKDHH